MRHAVIAVLTCATLAVSARAQNPTPFDLGMFFDQAGTVAEGEVPGFAAPTRLYLLMRNLEEQIVGYEASVSVSGGGSEDWVITRGTPTGIDVDPAPDGYVVGIGVCAGDIGGNYEINTYDFAYFLSTDGPNDTLVCAGPPTVINPTFPGFASYQTCSGGLWTADFADLGGTCPPGCAVLNPQSSCAVPVERGSWGSLKATF